MPANFISEVIPMDLPRNGTLLVTRDDKAGKVNIAVGVGNKLTTFSLGVAGWRALSKALGVPPAADFVPEVRKCRVCAQGDDVRKAWRSATLCAHCVEVPARPVAP